ncbi:MAG: diguanylate cyclase [Clostridiales bacterium]|nr:diguanylate cyclase [Clostridiales bacterium]
MENKTRSRVMLAITLFSAIELSGTVFVCARRAGKEVTQRSFDELTTATKQLAKDINNAARTDQIILSAMAELIAGQDEDDLDSVLRIMNTFSLDKTFVSTVALLRPDGTLLTDGARYDVSGAFDFETEAARGAYISDRVTSYFAPEKLVVRNVVPVKRDGETIAILYGMVPLQELSRSYKTDLYGGNAFVLIVDGNTGDILVDTWHNTLGNLSDLSGRKMLMGYTYEEAMKEIPNGIGGDMCTVSRSTGLTLYLHYEPVGINNWSVVLGVSEQDALAGTRGVVKILYLMSVIVGVILLSYLAYISWYLISARRGVYRMSITDQGTGLMNRVAYEKLLHGGEGHTSVPTVCIYIDANGLHEINNKHGHGAGDKLLQSVAECLRAQFPDGGLYRIGGDEFVVFSKADAAVCEARMQAVSSALAAQDYSISYGIAAQRASAGLGDLVREADENMLKNKRSYYAEHDRRRPR